jgi:serine phosphatase RsbU (regulator of sigma subunit)
VPVVHALVPDDRILLFTDGAVEGRRPSDRAFRSDDALWHDAIGAQTAEQTVDDVFRGVTEWAHGHLTDDVAVVSVRMMKPSEQCNEPLAKTDDGVMA